MNSLLAAAVTAFLFTAGDPQIMLDTQYRAYTKAQAFFPEKINKYRDRTLNKKKRLPKLKHLLTQILIGSSMHHQSSNLIGINLRRSNNNNLLDCCSVMRLADMESCSRQT